ncbi:MAG: hypothetical protein AABX28_02600 [Nanoarchaeota archaeon]
MSLKVESIELYKTKVIIPMVVKRIEYSNNLSTARIKLTKDATRVLPPIIKTAFNNCKFLL